MRFKAFLAVMAAALVLPGCASMSGSECELSDWRGIGFEDGSRGQSTEIVAKRRKACAKHGVAIDHAAYMEGRAEGLRVYCQPQTGFNLGAGGGVYRGICPADLEPAFGDAYNAGRRLHDLQSDVNATVAAINTRRYQLEQAAEDMKSKEAAVVRSDTPAEERVVLLSEIRELAEREGQLEAEIVELERERVREEARLEDYRATLYYD